MSKKGMTTGEEFEDFLKFAMKYRPQKRRAKSKPKERACFTPSEVRDIFKQNNLTDESLYKRLLGMGESSKVLVQRILHPTEKDLELEQSVKEKDLYLDRSSSLFVSS